MNDDKQKTDDFIRTRVYKITMREKSNGNYTLHRECDGFTALELLGLLERTKQDILDQITGRMPKPDFVERTVINPNDCKA